MQIAVQTGSTVYFAHDVGRPWVIEELRPALWVYSDRAGLQFLAEVTLPRTRDPRTGKPLTTNVSGSAYTTPNRWQQLAIVDFPRELLKQVHILRSQLSLNVDSREAYVSRVLLNVCGGVGVTNVWTDDLEVYGHVPSGGESGFAGPAASCWRLPRPARGFRKQHDEQQPAGDHTPRCAAGTAAARGEVGPFRADGQRQSDLSSRGGIPRRAIGVSQAVGL